ncbi:ABC transporter permease [Candidatus Saccharibacteria bacterium]|nr:MAG: ABC transporter permease [Candidatus Saccharibacteria bacterium]
MKRYIQGVVGLFVAYQRRFYRDKTAMFFTFLFPLIFLFVFGSIFNNNDISFRVALINRSQNQFATDFVAKIKKDSSFKVSESITTFDDAKLRMSRGEIDTIIELPESFGAINPQQVPAGALKVYYQQGSEQSGQTVAAVMQQVLDGINRQLGRPDPALSVERVSTGAKGASSFDYTFSGLLGFTILSMGIFGLANSMPQEKQKGAFRRLRASPFRTSQLISANALHYLVVGVLSVALMVIIGVTVFHFQLRGSWLVFAVYTLVSVATMLGFGLLIGGWAKNENQSAPLSNLVSFPMMFLSGTFFPRFLFPEWLQGVTAYLPLTPVIEGLRRIMTEHATLIDVLPQFGLIVLWGIVIYFLAIRLFRWE